MSIRVDLTLQLNDVEGFPRFYADEQTKERITTEVRAAILRMLAGGDENVLAAMASAGVISHQLTLNQLQDNLTGSLGDALGIPGGGSPITGVPRPPTVEEEPK